MPLLYDFCDVKHILGLADRDKAAQMSKNCRYYRHIGVLKTGVQAFSKSQAKADDRVKFLKKEMDFAGLSRL